LYFGLFNTIKYYVSLNSIDDMFDKNTIEPESKEKKLKPTKSFLTPKHSLTQTFHWKNSP